MSVSASSAQARSAEQAESIRRRFAEAWGRMGAAWGIAPSTAAVQGYLLAHGGPVTDAELQQALGLSHRAIRVALASCEEWGIVQRADEPRRSGRRGPAGRAWIALDDHSEWFRRVIEGRKEREGDPVIAILEECLADVRDIDSSEEAERLQQRLESLLVFVRQFDHALAAVLLADTATLRKLLTVLAAQDERDIEHLLETLSAVPEEDLSRAVAGVSRLSADGLQRLLRLASHPAISRLLSGGGAA